MSQAQGTVRVDRSRIKDGTGRGLIVGNRTMVEDCAIIVAVVNAPTAGCRGIVGDGAFYHCQRAKVGHTAAIAGAPVANGEAVHGGSSS